MDDYALAVVCLECGHLTNKYVSWLEVNNRFTCQCGSEVSFDGHEIIKDSLSPRERLFWKPQK